MGYQPLEAGKVWIDGLLLNKKNVNAIRKKIIWVPQKFNMSIQNGEELATLLNLQNHIGKIKDFMHCFQLYNHLFYNSFHELSEGEKQRLVTAICLCLERPILLLDEPTSALNENLIQLLVDVIHKETDKTIFSISHNKIWLNNADRIISL